MTRLSLSYSHLPWRGQVPSNRQRQLLPGVCALPLFGGCQGRGGCAVKVTQTALRGKSLDCTEPVSGFLGRQDWYDFFECEARLREATALVSSPAAPEEQVHPFPFCSAAVRSGWPLFSRS